MTPEIAIALVLQTADWAQTRTIADNPQSFHEYNQVLGRHPSIGAVNTYFLASTAVHLALDQALVGRWRKGHAYFWVATGAFNVSHNVAAGIKMTF
jgi:hypothetical protein